MNRPERFNKKAFVSFSVTFIWIIIALTGIVLFFSPPGRVANWVEWRFLGLTKEGWQGVHTIFSFIFVVTAVFHLYYNWVVFWSYIKSKAKAGIKMGRELAWSGGLTFTFLVLIVINVPPFSTAMDFGEYLSESWGSQEKEPPIPHAELLTVKEYAEKINLELNQALHNLDDAGLKSVDSQIVIGKLAERNNITPYEISSLISPPSTGTMTLGSNYGYGRMTIDQVSNDLNITKESVLNRLSNANIKFSKEEILKTIADNNDLKPIELMSIIRGENTNKEDDIQ